MPKRAYRLDKDDTFTVKYSVKYKDDGTLVARNPLSGIQLKYDWYQTNIMGVNRYVLLDWREGQTAKANIRSKHTGPNSQSMFKGWTRVTAA
jgi:hypothetical protein